MRINKYLASHGYSTRRGGDELVTQKKVYINGRLAVLGDIVKEGDTVEVRHRGPVKKYAYFAYNKPRGTLTGVPASAAKGIFPIGRLDKDSSGLLILTNDGRITDRLLHPDHDHEKEYIVKTREKLRANFKQKMEAGVRIEGSEGNEDDDRRGKNNTGFYTTKPCRVRVLDDHTFRIILTEGKKHQIRRMCVALFNEVRELTRVRIMNIKLGNLKAGSTRKIEGAELETFLRSIGL